MIRAIVELLILPLSLLVALLRFAVRLAFRPRAPEWIDLHLEGSLRWRDLRRRRWAFGRRRSGPTLQQLEAILNRIEREPSLRGVILHASKLRAGRTRMLALRDRLARLRAAGKEVVLYFRHADNRHFALAPVASRILLAPGGPVHLVGYAAAVTVLREALDRIGLKPEFFRQGRWKTAPERFTERVISEEHRALVERVLDHAHANLVADLAARRGGDEAWARRTIDGGPYTSRRALEAGIVDGLAYPDELALVLAQPAHAPAASPAQPQREGNAQSKGKNAAQPKRERSTQPQADDSTRPRGEGSERRESNRTIAPPGADDDRPRARIAPAEVLQARRLWVMRPPRLRRPPRIAVVPLTGLIKPGKSFRWPGGGQMAGDESIVRALDDVRKDRRVVGVIFAIDSRGGAANASELIWRAARRCAEAKPTVALVETVAASGGYFAAAGAAHIVAAPGALVGSIGVFSGRFDARALLDRLGVHQEVIRRGARAALLEPAHALDEGDRAVLAAEVASVYEEFVARVAEGRGRSIDAIRACAEGKVFLGSEAPPALVDRVGDFRDALSWACGEAGVDPERVEVLAHERAGVRPDLSELFALGRAAAAGMPLLLWADEVRPLGAAGAGG